MTEAAYGEWQPIATAPKDGTRILVVCEFAGKRDVTVVRWCDSPAPAGPFGRFTWREMQDSALAERIPTHWMPIPRLPQRNPSAQSKKPAPRHRNKAA